MTKLYTPLEMAQKILEKTLELQKAEKNSAHVIEEGKKVAVGLVKKKGIGDLDNGMLTMVPINN